MAEVQVRIAGRAYRLACADGEEESVRAYAAELDELAGRISRKMSQPVPEGRLMVMVGLMLADQASATESRIRNLERQLAEARLMAERRASPDLFQKDGEAALAGRINAIAERIESLTAKMV
ncbi:MAG: cell division protein ZapA [Pseudomonadota bacterium]